jgi:hypothetical protein
MLALSSEVVYIYERHYMTVTFEISIIYYEYVTAADREMVFLLPQAVTGK